VPVIGKQRADWKPFGKIVLRMLSGGTVKKLLHFDSPREWYVCDAAIVSCFDSRFDAGFAKFLKLQGVTNPDPIRIAGGAKTLASPDSESDRAFVVEQIQKSVNLHGTKRVILTLHSDCGAYGRLAKFRGDTAAEAAHHQRELHRAAENLRAAIPGIEVDAYFVDFEGIWEVEVSAVEEARPAV
jgi:carbonic anhydrase